VVKLAILRQRIDAGSLGKLLRWFEHAALVKNGRDVHGLARFTHKIVSEVLRHFRSATDDVNLEALKLSETGAPEFYASGNDCPTAPPPPRGAAEQLHATLSLAACPCAAGRGATRRSAASSTTLNRYDFFPFVPRCAWTRHADACATRKSVLPNTPR